jgi:mediator of RNA polymerase II transcription subunit 17, fungi type
MTQARDLITTILASVPSSILGNSQTQASAPLSSTFVSNPEPVPSVKAFNSQLVVGGKDQALRKASTMFKSAADSMERSRQRGEKYWVDALKIRRSNWGLVPAPLPYGSTLVKGSDRTSNDFLVSFGLEECMFALALIVRY